MKLNLQQTDFFEDRHHGGRRSTGQTDSTLAAMLTTIGIGSIDELIDQTVPATIRLPRPLNLPAPKSENQFLTDFRKLANQNKIAKSYIGMGYYDTITPNVMSFGIFLENPGWYTAYTRLTRPKLPRDGSKRCLIFRPLSAT